MKKTSRGEQAARRAFLKLGGTAAAGVLAQSAHAQSPKPVNPVIHFEIGCRDLARTQKLYRDLFAWTIDATSIQGAGLPGHITALGHEPQNYTIFYVQVEDVPAHIAKAEGATLRDAVRLVVYVTDMARLRPLVNRIQEELWGGGPYPPRTIVEVSKLNQDDIFEVEGTFFAPLTTAKK